MTTKISREDVQFVCDELNINSTPELIDYVMEHYDGHLSSDPEGNYFYIIEDLIYQYLCNSN